MLTVSNVLFGLVALLHFYFLILEMFLWEKPLGRKTFGQSREQAAATAVLAKNQGLYNGFLTAGILWALAEPNPSLGARAKLFFGLCVVVAGLYGAWSTKKRAILLIQALPALLAIVTLVVGGAR